MGIGGGLNILVCVRFCHVLFCPPKGDDALQKVGNLSSQPRSDSADFPVLVLVYVWNPNKESADTESGGCDNNDLIAMWNIAPCIAFWLLLTFPPSVCVWGEGSGESEKEKCKFRGGRTTPVGGGGRGCRDSSWLFLATHLAVKTLQSPTFALQVKATLS